MVALCGAFLSPLQAMAADVVPTTSTVTLDGEAVSARVVEAEEGRLIEAGPVLDALGNTYDFDEATGVLTVTRSQDGAVMALHTEDGLVSANGKDLGRLKDVGSVTSEGLYLTPNALAVLSGANGKYDEKSDSYALKLDPRLRVATGFDIFVNGVSLVEVSPQPRAVGPVILLPLRPIAEALGSDVQSVDAGAAVRVRRVQDSAVFTLDLGTGLVELNGNPVGVARNITYADPVNLLLPKEAVEALTGTRVRLEAGTSRIEVDLDSRLRDTVRPGDRVEEIAARTPFTPEALSFEAGPDIINTADFDFRVRGVNARARLELPDLPEVGAELEPAWLSLDFAHVSGIRGTLGDLSTSHRELSGVGLSRLRGASAFKTTEKGRWSAAIGTPARGTRRISEEQSRLTFSGLAAGGRWADADGWEAGLALRSDSLTNDQMAVLSAISGRLGRRTDGPWSWNAQADAGLFKGPARVKTLDIRGAAGVRREIGETLSVDAFARYDGVEFERTDLDREDRERAITDAFSDDPSEDEDLLPKIRERGSDRTAFGIGASWTPSSTEHLTGPAVSLRAERTVIGGDRALTSDRLTLGTAATLARTGIGLSANGTHYTNSGNVDGSGYALSVRAHKDFRRARVRAQYALTGTTDAQADQTVRQEVLTTTVTAVPVTLPLPSLATLSLAPSVTGSLIDGDASLRAGVTANFESGEMFGERNRVTATLGVLQSVSPRGRLSTDEFLSVNVLRNVSLGDNMAVGLGVRSDLSGEVDIGLRLRGRFDFNPRRRLRRTREDSGVLTGTVFLDTNRNDVWDEGEEAVPGVRVALQNTPYALRADASGAFTVQNLRKGLFEVRVDARSLPLGYAQSETAPRRATVDDGRVTDIAIPVVARGQLRGFVYEDADGSGTFERGEVRPEDVRLTLLGNGIEESMRTTSFGQFAFDDLPAGTYRVMRGDRELASVDLSAFDRLLGKVRIALPEDDPPDTKHQVEAASRVDASP